MPRHTILLRGDLDNDVMLLEENTLASEAITPGDLLEEGGAQDIQLHSTASANNRRMFALEQPGKEGTTPTTLAIDNPYAVGETVRAAIVRRGAVVYATLATGNNAAKGAPLESNGAGQLQLVAASVATSESQRESLVGYAVEAVNATAAAARIPVEVA